MPLAAEAPSPQAPRCAPATPSRRPLARKDRRLAGRLLPRRRLTPRRLAPRRRDTTTCREERRLDQLTATSKTSLTPDLPPTWSPSSRALAARGSVHPVRQVRAAAA